MITRNGMLEDVATNREVEMNSSKSRPILYLEPFSADDGLARALSDGGWKVDMVSNVEDALALMDRREYAVGLVHLDGEDLDQKAMRRQAEDLLVANNRTNWVALLSNMQGGLGPVSAILSRYCYDYHTMPVETDRLIMTLGHAHGMAAISEGVSAQDVDPSPGFGMVGRSRCMRALFQQIGKIASIDFSVLICGESGTGKELTAQAIHRVSHRADGPFVAVNCGALPKDLIQAELFGHEKGAFTGAERRRIGRVEAAQGGTLFLDEIGDLPLDLQINLLRFLQEKTIDRVGGSGQITVDVRVIAATNVNLEKAVKEGRFREDLYYRLNVLHVDMPPLRERAEDVQLLAHHLLAKFAARINPNLQGFSQQAIDGINAHTWPGNVREMVNRIQRAVVMCEGKLIRPRDLGLDQDVHIQHLDTLAEARAKAEKAAIEATLQAVRNNVSKAARHLGVSRVTLYRLMELHSIEWQGSKSA